MSGLDFAAMYGLAVLMLGLRCLNQDTLNSGPSCFQDADL